MEKAHRCALSCCHGEILIGHYIVEPAINGLVGGWIDQFQFHLAGELFAGQVHDLGAEVDAVAFAQEAWRIGLHHQFFLCDHVFGAVPEGQFFGMRHDHPLPGSERFGHGEVELNVAIGIGMELRKEEGGFIEIGANGRLRSEQQGYC